MTCGFLNTTGILQKKKTMWFIGVEVEQETSAPPPKKNPGSAPELHRSFSVWLRAPACSWLPDFVKLVTVVICCRFTVPHNSEKPGNQFKNSNHSKMADVLLGKGKLKP